MTFGAWCGVAVGVAFLGVVFLGWWMCREDPPPPYIIELAPYPPALLVPLNLDAYTVSWDMAFGTGKENMAKNCNHTASAVVCTCDLQEKIDRLVSDCNSKETRAIMAEKRAALLEEKLNYFRLMGGSDGYGVKHVVRYVTKDGATRDENVSSMPKDPSLFVAAYTRPNWPVSIHDLYAVPYIEKRAYHKTGSLTVIHEYREQ